MSKYGLTLCPKCGDYPSLSLNKDKPNDILIQCDKCEYNQYTSLHNYLYQMKATLISISNNNNFCTNHNQPLIIYCTKCKLYLCNQSSITSINKIR